MPAGPQGNPTPDTWDIDYSEFKDDEEDDRLAAPGPLPADYSVGEDATPNLTSAIAPESEVGGPAGSYQHIDTSNLGGGMGAPPPSTPPGGNVGVDTASAFPSPGVPQDPQQPWTYEQTFMDPYVRDVMGREDESIQSSMAGIAAGEMSPVIQQQRERAMQQALSAAASTRGAPAAAVQRAMTQQMSEADRSAMEAASQQQLQAGQMVDEARQAEAQINAQLEAQRDSMVDSLVGRGVDRNVALMQVSAELDKQKRDLTYRYWAGRLGSTTELLTQAVESADFWEGGVEGVGEMAPVINMLMGYGTPEDYAGPTQRILAGDDPQTIYTETTNQGMPSPDQYEWDFDTQSWGLKPGVQSDHEYMGMQDFAGSQVALFRSWNDDEGRYDYSFGSSGPEHGGRTDPSGNIVTSGIEAKENVIPIGKDEFMRQRDKGMKQGMMGTTGTMRKPEFGMAPSLTQPGRMTGAPKLGDVNKGLKPSSWKDKAITGLKVGREILGGVDAGKNILLGRTKEEQNQGIKDLGVYAASRALGEGYNALEDYLSAPDDIEKNVGDYAEEAVKALAEKEGPEVAAALKEGASEISKEATSSVLETTGELAEEIPVAGPAVSMGTSLASGEGLGKSAAKAGGGAAGAAIGTAMAPGIGTVLGSILGSKGAGAGYDAIAGKKRTFGGGSTAYMDPSQHIPQYQPSGLETKKYIEGLHTGSGYGEYIGSDEGMKSDKEPSKDELSSFLRELEPVKYDYKPEYGGEKDQYGIIAQDAEKTPVGQSFVKKDQNGSRVIDTGKATMVNMAASANQQKIMDTQGMMIADLLKRIGRLEGTE